MADRLTTEELRALRALADAATEGPWWAHHISAGYQLVDSKAGWIAHIRLGCSNGGSLTPRKDEADARFVAGARNAVPRLLDDLEAMRRERNEARTMLRRLAAMHPVTEAPDTLHAVKRALARWDAERAGGG